MQIINLILKVNKARSKLFGFLILIAFVDGIFFYSLSILIAGFGEGGNITSYPVVLIQLVTIYVLNLATSYLIRRHGEKIAITSSELGKQIFFKQILNTPIHILQRFHSGYLLSLVNRVTDTLPQLIFQLYWWACRGIVVSVMFFVYVFYHSVWIVIFDAAIIIIFVYVSTLLSRQILPLNITLNEKKAIFMGRYADFLTNLLTVKRLGVGDFALENIDSTYQSVLHAVDDQQKYHAKRWLILHGLFGLMFILTVAFFLFQVSSGLISINIFIILIAFFIHLRGDLNALAENLKLLTEVNGYLAQLQKIIPTSLKSRKIIKSAHFQQLRIKEATFAYPDSQIELQIDDLFLQNGEIIAIVGNSGEGKSTLLSLIAGQLDLTSGLREQVGGSEDDFTFVSQEVELFDLSLRENLLLGKNISDEILMTHLNYLGLEKLVTSHTEGLEVLLGEKGLKLSSGQKQRVNLIRSILLDKSIILLDEPISHLDSQNALLVINYLSKYLVGKTAVIVSHQKKLLDLASRTYEFRGHKLSTYESRKSL